MMRDTFRVTDHRRCGHGQPAYSRGCDKCRALAEARRAELLDMPLVTRELAVPVTLAGYPERLVPKGGRAHA